MADEPVVYLAGCLFDRKVVELRKNGGQSKGQSVVEGAVTYGHW